nr:GcrA cell cycle regulator [Aerococcus urinae]
MAWTDEGEETLKRLWADGLSAGQIAKRLGGVTRNAVIGKVHRLGLSGRVTPSRPARPIPAPRPPRADPVKIIRPPVEEPMPVMPQIAAALSEHTGGAPRAVIELRNRYCKWPIGSPEDEGFHFCGAPRPSEAQPYCAAHARIAYEPEKVRNKENRKAARNLF